MRIRKRIDEKDGNYAKNKLSHNGIVFGRRNDLIPAATQPIMAKLWQ